MRIRRRKRKGRQTTQARAGCLFEAPAGQQDQAAAKAPQKPAASYTRKRFPDGISPEERRALQRLGVPRDLELPIRLELRLPGGVGRKPDRRRQRATIRSARGAVARLRAALLVLTEPEPVSVAVELKARRVIAALSRGEDLATLSFEPREDTIARHFRTLDEIESELALLGEITTGHPGRRQDWHTNETAERLRQVGLGDGRVAEALRVLGYEGAGDAKSRVRNRRRRAVSR